MRGRGAGPFFDAFLDYNYGRFLLKRLGEVDLARKYAELARTTPIPNQD